MIKERKMKIKICLIAGDGVGPEVVREAKKVLDKVAAVYSHDFDYAEALAGGAAYDAGGKADGGENEADNAGGFLPKETIETAKNCDAILLGAVGGPAWDNIKGGRPELAILGLRKTFDLFANLRPAILFSELKDASSLKKEVIGGGLDILIVRELTGGIYFGEKTRSGKGTEETASDIEKYSRAEIERIARVAFDLAKKRNGKLTSVDKANVLESSRLWREVVGEVATDFPDVELSHLYVDNAAMQLVRNPKQFDTILTNNIFGDILSDEASEIVGSIGMLPSASLGSSRFGLYEPIHGSAPEIAGKDEANPIATILSAAMMLRYSFSLTKEAAAIEAAVASFLASGHRTRDIHEKGMILVGTKSAGSLIAENIG
jgi:3-isopropylmalate dehydrogenase